MKRGPRPSLAPGPSKRSTRLSVRAMAAAGDGAPKRIVICGGGIIGVSTAYYLATTKGLPCTLVERHEVAGAASGKAGGFLALDWNDGSPVGRLARRSYQLHAELAAALGPDAVGYRTVSTLSVAAAAAGGGGGGRRKRLGAPLPAWLDGEGILESSQIGSPSTTAQVHPRQLTRALWAAAEAAGAKLVRDAVVGLEFGEGRAVTGVQLEVAGTLPADAVLIALGPWTAQACAWLPQLPGVGGQKAHSVVLRPRGGGGGGGAVDATAVFTAYRDGAGKLREPEIYPRPDGTVYVCGESSSTPVPLDPASVRPDSGAAGERIREVAGALAGALRGAEVVSEQACYLPVTSDGLPLIGRVPGAQGVFVGSGHSCWGILNGPATGLVLAELMAGGGGAPSVEGVAAFDPARRSAARQFGAV